MHLRPKLSRHLHGIKDRSSGRIYSILKELWREPYGVEPWSSMEILSTWATFWWIRMSNNRIEKELRIES